MAGESCISARQFLAIVGDETEEIRKGIVKEFEASPSARCFTIKNDYYRCDVGIQAFSDIKRVKEAGEHEKIISAVVVRFNGIAELNKINENTSNPKIDVKIIVANGNESDDEKGDLEKWSISNGFEIVYLNHTEEEVEEANENFEKLGIQRIAEALHVCNWPFRQDTINSSNVNPNLARLIETLKNSDFSENEDDEFDDFTLAGASIDAVWNSYQRQNCICECELSCGTRTPEPQHAERVYVSTESPTGTDTTCHDDASVSLEVEFVCKKPHQEQVDTKDPKITAAVPAKKKNKKKNRRN